MLLQIVTLMLLAVASIHANSPPGVPPQQQQFQKQQMNIQEGQAQGHGHGHGHGGHGGKKLKFQSEIHNADHIMEHLQNVIKTKPKDQMSEEELEFHYFKMHDYDNNNKLDGVEIGKALTHFHDEEEGGANKDSKVPETHEDELQEMIDDILHEDDLNDDGYVDYAEFMKGQKRRGEFGDDEKPYTPSKF